MANREPYDAVVVGSGPNGLAAAITLARQGLSVLVLEARDTVGGGTRTAELTLPGFKHDICATVITTALISPFMRSLPLEEYGMEIVQPDIPVAHPLDGGQAALLHRSVEQTALGLGRDAGAYRSILGPVVRNWKKITTDILGPLPLPPRHPLELVGFGLWAIQPASFSARLAFRGDPARALFGGLSGHSIIPLNRLATTAFGLLMGIGAHAVGWPIVRGGTHNLSAALVSILQSLGGEVITGHEVRTLKDLPPSKAVFFDVTPRTFLCITGEALPSGYRRALTRYRYGPGVCKVDYALAGPVPWSNPDCSRAGTLHLGGKLEEIEASEAEVWRGGHPQKPFVLVVQPSSFDSTRAPAGKHTLWTYCHVPNGSTLDVTANIEAQIERFAPGFRDLVLARHVYTAAEMGEYNPNYVGGDINSGVQDLRQLFTRPVPRLNPYRTPLPGMYLCSGSTPPGGGVHGMSGYHAARTALKQVFHLVDLDIKSL